MSSSTSCAAEPSLNTPTPIPRAPDALARGAADQACARPLRVFLFDLLPTVPYYTGHLAAALSGVSNLELGLGAATYVRDRTFFQRIGLRKAPGVFDFAASFDSHPLRRGMKLAEYLWNMAALAARFVRNKPDIVHVQFTPLLERRLPFELWFLRTVHALGIKLMYTVHNILPHENGDELRSAYASLYRLMDGFICHDYAAKERLIREFDVDRRLISVIPHGPLFSEMGDSAERSDRAPSSGKPVVLWQGIIRPYKGLSILLRAWQRAIRSGMTAELVIVGTGNDEILESIRQQVCALEIESSVRLDLRFVSTEEVAEYYDEADLVVYPYSQITTSGALMTGIGRGKAIIASDLPAFRQILRHEKDALLAQPDNVNAWADAIVRLTSDSELRARLAAQLSSHQTRLLPDWNAIARDTMRAYQSLNSLANIS